MHQQGIISCKNIYLSGIVLNHLHGVPPLSIWGVRWLGLGPPAVFESYRSLHTLPSDKLTPPSKNPLSRWPGVNSLHFRLPKNLSRTLIAHNFSPIGCYDSRITRFSSYKDTSKKQCHIEPGIMSSTSRITCIYHSLYIDRYTPQLMGRERMVTAGSRRVMESYREINDRLAVVPEAMMEIGHTHIYLLTAHARVCTHARRGGCQGREWCMLHWVFLTSLSSQGKQGHAAWLLTDTWICVAGSLSRGWWGLFMCMSVCARQNSGTWISRVAHPPRPHPPKYSPKARESAWSSCAARPHNCPFIALQSLYWCLNMYINSCCVLLCVCPWDNCPF